MINTANFSKSTFAIFKGCKCPKRKADFISYNKRAIISHFIFDDLKEYLAIRKEGNHEYYFFTENGLSFFNSNYGELTQYPIKIDYELIQFEYQKTVIVEYRPISSTYWYGEDSTGKYIIRYSDHWSNYRNFDANIIFDGCEMIASCKWSIKSTTYNKNERNLLAGKCYLANFKKI